MSTTGPLKPSARRVSAAFAPASPAPTITYGSMTSLSHTSPGQAGVPGRGGQISEAGDLIDNHAQPGGVVGCGQPVRPQCRVERRRGAVGEQDDQLGEQLALPGLHGGDGPA